MALSAAPADRRCPLLRFPLPGGVDAVRLPSSVDEGVLDEALRSDAPWLLLDATGSDDGVEVVAPVVARALDRSSRTAARTCLVCRRRLPQGAGSLATFATMEDACQARLLAEAGYGRGWDPPPASGRQAQLVAL